MPHVLSTVPMATNARGTPSKAPRAAAFVGRPARCCGSGGNQGRTWQGTLAANVGAGNARCRTAPDVRGAPGKAPSRPASSQGRTRQGTLAAGAAVRMRQRVLDDNAATPQVRCSVHAAHKHTAPDDALVALTHRGAPGKAPCLPATRQLQHYKKHNALYMVLSPHLPPPAGLDGLLFSALC